MEFSKNLKLNYTSQKSISRNWKNQSIQNIYQHQNMKNYRKKIINISQESIFSQIQKLQWRKKTDFPIVKIINYKQINFTNNKLSSFYDKKVQLSLMVEPISYTLNQIDQIPIVKTFYLLKQTLIASQRLCLIYGNFIINSKMIGINLQNKCKIWHNSSFHANESQFQTNNQKQTVKSIIQVFKFKTKCSILSNKLFQQLETCEKLYQCLKVIKSITNASKIRVPKSFVVSDIFSSNLCSPRKYISRPPSNQKNPQSIQSPCKNDPVALYIKKKLQSFLTPTKKSLEKPQKRLIESINFTKKYNKNIQTQNQYPKKQQKRTFLKYLQFDKKRKHFSQKISPITTPRKQLLSPKNPKNLLVIQSVYEGDSDEGDDVSYVISMQKIASLQIPRLSKSAKLQMDFSSSQFDTRSSLQKNTDRQMMTCRLNKNLQSTLDSTLILKRCKQIN